MTSLRSAAVAAALSVVLLAAGACGGDKGDGSKVTKVTSGPGEKTEGAPITFRASLSGAEEVPGPGVKEGVGSFVIDVGGTRGCYELRATMGEKPKQAHLHQGARGSAGPVVVDLKPAFESGESDFLAKSCIDLAADLAAKLAADPVGYYVNVHTDAHPNGAMRGQLAKS